MYDPSEVRKSFLELLKERGGNAAIQSVLIIIAWYVFNSFTGMTFVSSPILIIFYFALLSYFTWKPKLIQFLRGVLRGKERWDKED